MKYDKKRQNEQRNIIQEVAYAKQLLKNGKIKEAHQIVLELEKSGNYSSKESHSIKLLKADIFNKSGEFLEAINCTKELFQQFQKEEDLLSSYDTLIIQAHSVIMLGKLSQGEMLIKQAETLLNRIKKAFSIDLRERESYLARIIGILHSFKGEVRKSLEFNKKAYELAKDTNNIVLISASLTNLGFNYYYLKEYDEAIKYSKKSIGLKNELGMAFPLGNLIEIYIKKGEMKEAKVYYEYLGELKEKYNTKIYNEIYNMYTAELLKVSLRSRKRIEAEDIFQKVAFDDTASHEGRIAALLNLCDLLLIELRLTNDPEVLDEIQLYIQKLLEIAESHKFSMILAETYLLQAKISLLTFDNKSAQRFLTQAKQIAERFGLIEMIDRISNERSVLLKKSDAWEQLKNSDAPMVERIKLARLHEQIEELDEKRVVLPAFISEEQVTIHQEKKICLVCRGEVSKFSYICECGVIYCGNCAQALTNLENVCWVCDNPIDYSKPVKSRVDEPERIYNSENLKKK